MICLGPDFDVDWYVKFPFFEITAHGVIYGRRRVAEVHTRHDDGKDPGVIDPGRVARAIALVPNMLSLAQAVADDSSNREMADRARSLINIIAGPDPLQYTLSLDTNR